MGIIVGLLNAVAVAIHHSVIDYMQVPHNDVDFQGKTSILELTI